VIEQELVWTRTLIHPDSRRESHCHGIEVVQTRGEMGCTENLKFERAPDP
jgi:hypothetical protein